MGTIGWRDGWKLWTNRCRLILKILTSILNNKLPCIDVREYAQFLGMNLDKDKKYFYIAREGLKAPLPE